MTLWWVMGASAVGKKTLIRRAVADLPVRMALGLTGAVRAIWMNEGPWDPGDVSAVGSGDALVRWQFGREARFAELGAGVMRRGILLVTAEPAVHYGRMLAREGARWTPAALAFEADAVRSLAGELAQRYAAPLRIVDVSQSDAPILQDGRAA